MRFGALAPYAPLAESGICGGPKPRVFSRFESEGEHHFNNYGLVRELVYRRVLETRICGFESHLGHQNIASCVVYSYNGCMRNTQRKGDIATTKVIALFTELGYDVSIPITESAAYDLVVDDGNALHRVQAKYCSGIQVDLRRIHSNSKGYVVKKYADQAYDWLAVYRPSGDIYIIKEFSDNVTLNLRDEWKVNPKAGDGITLEK